MNPQTKYEIKNICIFGVGAVGGVFGGTIIRLGKDLGVPTPVTESIYSKLAG